MTMVLVVVLVAIVFEYINGFHDTANSIATVVSTKVLSPRQAIVLAAVTNLLGALAGTAVAQTIASGLVDSSVVTLMVLVSALIGAISWNIITWWFGLPSSSSHALIGGLCGASLAAAKGNWHVIIWSQPAATWAKSKGLLWKVIVPMISSPVAGLLLGFLFMALLYALLHRMRPYTVNKTFGKVQMFSAAGMGFMHGTNDAQKTMGIIALALVAGTSAGAFEHLPGWLQFLHTPPPPPGENIPIALWIKILCALTMASGTAAGGWRIIKTLGHKMVKLQPVNGVAAEASSALVILGATHFGLPVSTTHTISAAILGVGAAKRFTAVKWSVVEQIIWGWIFTIPASGLVGFLLQEAAQSIGIH